MQAAVAVTAGMNRKSAGRITSEPARRLNATNPPLPNPPLAADLPPQAQAQAQGCRVTGGDSGRLNPNLTGAG